MAAFLELMTRLSYRIVQLMGVESDVGVRHGIVTVDDRFF